MALFGDAIDEIGEYYCQSEQFSIDNMGIQNRESRDGSSFHITILSPEDVEASGFHLKSEALDELVCNVNRMEVFNVGLGKVKTSTSPASEVWFALVFVEWAQALRSRLKLPNKHLHITLAFQVNDALYGPYKRLYVNFRSMQYDDGDFPFSCACVYLHKTFGL